MSKNRLALLAVSTTALALGLWVGAASGARDTAHALSFQQVASGLASPVDVASAPGDPSTLYVVEQQGTIKIVEGGQVTGTFLDIRSRVRSGGEQGLLSVAFHPAYAQNHRFYVDYTDTNGDTRVVEFTSANGVGRPGSARELLFVHQPYANHNGGQLQFDTSGYLYVGMGDGGSGGDPDNRAQNLKSRLGKLLRINPTRAGSVWQIVGFGLRNPWRFSFDRKTGDLWIGDVGQNTWEEVDYRAAARIGKLANYGWSRFEGRSTYNPGKPLVHEGDLVGPQWVYSHSDGCSITGGYVYRGSSMPAAAGRYFFGDYCSGTIWSFKAGKGRASVPSALGKIANLSSFGEDANGELYAVSTDGTLFALRV
ncbi:MAG TPA: PQQ-dependent sugar dehydrogenase [Gaiellaceae bacterium]